MSLTQALDDFENMLEKEMTTLKDFENELEKEWASQKDKCDELDKKIDELVKRDMFDEKIDQLHYERLHALGMMKLVAKYRASSALSRANGYEELRRRAEEELDKTTIECFYKAKHGEDSKLP